METWKWTHLWRTKVADNKKVSMITSRATKKDQEMQQNAGDPTVAAWARWVKGPFRSFMRKSGHTENIAGMTLSLEEDTIEHDIPDGAVEALAVRAGLDLSKEDLLTALAVYKKRKGLQPDLVKGCFVPWKAENKPAAEAGQRNEADADKAVGLGG